MKWFRATITFMFVLGITWGFVVGKIQAETYLAIAAVAVTWWYKSRDEAKKIGI